MNWRDEMRYACHGQNGPVPLESALNPIPPKKTFIHVAPSESLAEIWFESKISVLMAQGRIAKFKRLEATLKDGSTLKAVSEFAAEHGALRGITPVWVE